MLTYLALLEGDAEGAAENAKWAAVGAGFGFMDFAAAFQASLYRGAYIPRAAFNLAEGEGSYGVVSAARAADEGNPTVFSGGRYVKNPSARPIEEYVQNGQLKMPGTKKFTGSLMFAVDEDGTLITGVRGDRRSPHPTLLGGANPKVRTAGMLYFYRGKLVRVQNQSGHFQPSYGSLKHAHEALRTQAPDLFSPQFEGYFPERIEP